MGGSAKKQRPSAQELASARVAMQKDQRFNQAFRPLEQDAIAELESANAEARSQMLAGRQNSDLEQAAMQATQAGMRADSESNTFGSGATQERTSRMAAATQQAKDDIRTKADQQARDSIDQDTMNVIKTGQGVSRQAQSNITASARLANSEAMSRLQASQMKDQARANAIGAVASAGLAKGLQMKDRALKKHGAGSELQDGFVTQESDLNGFEKWMRNRWGNEVAM